METTATEWDPSALDSVTPSKDCLKRIRSDYKSLIKEPLQGIYCVPDESLVQKYHALIVGPFDTPYEGGFFYFVLNFPENYPNAPPRVKLMTTGGGTVRFNPNLYANGKVCLSILGTWSGPSWSPVQTLSSVLLSIQTLMCERPYHNEPGFEAPNPSASKKYNDCIRHETLRTAVCEMASTCSQAMSLPPALRQVVLSLFPGFVESYELACTSNCSKDGQPMIDPFGADRGVFNYSAILSKLVEIKSSWELGDEEDENIQPEEK